MTKHPSLQQLVACLRALPADALGEFQSQSQRLELVRKKDSLELHLRMKLRSDTSGEPLLMAAVEVPLSQAVPPSVRSLRALSGGTFSGRERKYFDAMVTWALVVLSRSPLPLVSKQNARPGDRAIKTVINAASGGSTAIARRYFKQNSSLLKDLEDAQRAMHAVFFLRDEGFAIHIDWRDGDQFNDLCLSVLERLGLLAVRNELASVTRSESLDDNVAIAADVLGRAGYSLASIDTAADDYMFVICANSAAEIVTKSLASLGVDAKVCRL